MRLVISSVKLSVLRVKCSVNSTRFYEWWYYLFNRGCRKRLQALRPVSCNFLLKEDKLTVISMIVGNDRFHLTAIITKRSCLLDVACCRSSPCRILTLSVTLCETLYIWITCYWLRWSCSQIACIESKSSVFFETF